MFISASASIPILYASSTLFTSFIACLLRMFCLFYLHLYLYLHLYIRLRLLSMSDLFYPYLMWLVCCFCLFCSVCVYVYTYICIYYLYLVRSIYGLYNLFIFNTLSTQFLFVSTFRFASTVPELFALSAISITCSIYICYLYLVHSIYICVYICICST